LIPIVFTEIMQVLTGYGLHPRQFCCYYYYE